MDSTNVEFAQKVEQYASKNHHDAADLLRKKRRNLFVASLFLLGIFVTDAVPTKIEPLGITFTDMESANVLSGLALVVLYLLARFAEQVLSYVRLRKRHLKRLEILNQVIQSQIDGITYPKIILSKYNKLLEKSEMPCAIFADILKLVVPIFVGVTAFFVGLFPVYFEFLKLLLGG